MLDKKKNILKTKLIVLMASVVCVLFQSAALANNWNNFQLQDLSKLSFYYRDAEKAHGVRVQPGETHPRNLQGETHPRNLQSVYSHHEQVNFMHMSVNDFGCIFQDVADENAILQNYELYAFEKFLDICTM